MKAMKIGLIFMFLVSSPLMAQHAGMRTAGLAPVTPFISAPVQPFVTAPVQAFGVAPIQVHPIRVGQILTQPVVVVSGYRQPVVAGYAAGYVYAAGNVYQPAYYPAYQSYQPVIVAQPQIVIPGSVIVPGAVVVPSTVVVTRPAPRAEFRSGPPPNQSARERAIREFGQPVTSVWSNGTETLTFRNGVTVTIPNGQVARPR